MEGSPGALRPQGAIPPPADAPAHRCDKRRKAGRPAATERLDERQAGWIDTDTACRPVLDAARCARQRACEQHLFHRGANVISACEPREHRQPEREHAHQRCNGVPGQQQATARRRAGRAPTACLASGRAEERRPCHRPRLAPPADGQRRCRIRHRWVMMRSASLAAMRSAAVSRRGSSGSTQDPGGRHQRFGAARAASGGW